MSKDKTNQKGITLIALVITIIVMLILVGVSVTVALNGGLFSTAKEAAEGTATKRNEELQLSSGKVEINGEWYNSIDEYVNGSETEKEVLEVGCYAADGTFTSWDDLVDNGDLIVNDGVLTSGSVTCETCGGCAFNGNGKLVIDDSVTTIGSNAFCCECLSLNTDLSEVIIPDSVTTISDYAFYNMSLDSIEIPDSVKSIGEGAFQMCRASSIKIGAGVTAVPAYAFNDCFDLTSITISNNVTTISDYAFFNCYDLTSIYIPESVTTISESAFGNCHSLKIYCGANGPQSGWQEDWNYCEEDSIYLDVTYGVTRAEYEEIIRNT